MAEKNDWWTCPATDTETSETIMVSGRRDIDTYRAKGKYNIRVDVAWRYGSTGYPDETTARTMEEVTEAFQAALKGKTAAVMTAIYTGAGVRQWIFYTLSEKLFTDFLNRSLAGFPLLPLEISAEKDPDWAEYDEMRSLTEILPE